MKHPFITLKGWHPMFELHPNFASKTFIADLPLCRLLLEDESHYPWIMLIPRRANISKMMDLSREDQMQLMIELDLAQNIMWDKFQPAQLNVAALGNKTPQLHIHVIARFTTDPAWPAAVWDHPVRARYTSEKKEEVVKLLSEEFLGLSTKSALE
jgi:diadenosine tetraphosphate (Ap4A) HIT family hydrolase